MVILAPQAPKVLAPAGTHTAICYQIIELGTQQSEWQGQVKRNFRIRFTWELLDELMDNGKPFAVSKEYNLSSFNKSTFMKDMKSWLGFEPTVGFDTSTLIGKACNVTVIHEPSKDGQNTYANVSTISPLKKNEVAPKSFNPPLVFELTPEKFSVSVLESLPDFLQEKIRKSPEYVEAINWMNGIRPDKTIYGPPAGHPVLNDEIPF